MKRRPTSPGEILSEEFLKPLGISKEELSDTLKCECNVIHQIINEKEEVTNDIAIKLAALFNTTPDFWLNAQLAFNLAS